MDDMPNLNIYIVTSIRSPKVDKGAGMYTIEYNKKKSGETVNRYGMLMREKTTMEGLTLQTLLAALSILIKPCSNRVITSCGAKFAKRIKDMQKQKENGWKTARGEPLKNLEEWKQIDTAMQVHKIIFQKNAENMTELNEEKEEKNEWEAWMTYIVNKSVKEYQEGKIYYPADKRKIEINITEGEGYLMTWKDEDL